MVEFTDKDLQFISKVVNEPELFKCLVNSLCPTIFGHEIVKAGLLLSLVGGNGKMIGGPKGINVRGDIHMLIVGDPGLGKSQMLRAVSKVAPRGVYVSGLLLFFYFFFCFNITVT